MITTITGKNQITLPAEIVKRLDLMPGMQLEWRIGNDHSLIATPRPSKAKLAAKLMGSGRKYLQAGSNPVQNLIAERIADDHVN